MELFEKDAYTETNIAFGRFTPWRSLPQSPLPNPAPWRTPPGITRPPAGRSSTASAFASLTRALTRNTSLPLTGCCGKALPVTRLRLYYDGGEFYQDFTFEKLAGANEVLDTIAAARPDLSVEREERAQTAI